MKILDARAVGFSERPYDMTADGGTKGISRKISVSDGDEQDKLKFSEAAWEQLPEPVRNFIRTLGRSGFGSRVTAVFHGGDGVRGFGTLSLRLVDPNGEVVHDGLPADIAAAV